MKTVRETMTTDVVWISPTARVKAAVFLMKGHDIGALPVLNTNMTVAGLLTYHDILGEVQDTAVMDVMSKDYTAVDPSVSIYDAAELMYKNSVNCLLVVEDDRLVGIVTQADLIPEIRKTFDPLTELPWSDSFRDWAMNSLKRGMEISVLFFDLDHFGMFNKKYGHVVGDTVLKEVANVFKKNINLDSDLACRYGGDEFVVVSVRLADDAIALAETLHEQISKIEIPSLQEGVSASYGMWGGRRSKEREDTHYSATIDNLITRASKNCTAKKTHRAEILEPAPTPQPAAVEPVQAAVAPEPVRLGRLKIKTISISTSGPQSDVSVVLSRAGVEFSRTASGYVVDSSSTLRLVAQATADAACKSVAPEHAVAIDRIWLHDTDKDEIVTALAVFISPRYTTRTAGSAVVRRGDQYRAAASAVLSAINRLLEYAPEAESGESL